MTTVTDDQNGQLIKYSPVGWAGGFAHRLAFIWWAEKRCPPYQATRAAHPTRFINNFITSIFFSFTLLSCQNSLAETNYTPVFELTHTWGGVPTSIIKISPDGKVHFHRNETDAVHNRPATKAEDRYAQMTTEQLNELVDVFLSLPFDASKKLERVKDGYQIWHAFIAYRDKFINITIQDSIFFEFLENRMRKYINLKQLLCDEDDQDDCGTNVFNIPDDLQGLKKYMEP